MEKSINYGKLLEKALKNKGITKTFAYKKLGMSKPTLFTRLKDGRFTEQQLLIVKEYFLK